MLFFSRQRQELSLLILKLHNANQEIINSLFFITLYFFLSPLISNKFGISVPSYFSLSPNNAELITFLCHCKDSIIAKDFPGKSETGPRPEGQGLSAMVISRVGVPWALSNSALGAQLLVGCSAGVSA